MGKPRVLPGETGNCSGVVWNAAVRQEGLGAPHKPIPNPSAPTASSATSTGAQKENKAFPCAQTKEIPLGWEHHHVTVIPPGQELRSRPTVHKPLLWGKREPGQGVQPPGGNVGPRSHPGGCRVRGHAGISPWSQPRRGCGAAEGSSALGDSVAAVTAGAGTRARQELRAGSQTLGWPSPKAPKLGAP